MDGETKAWCVFCASIFIWMGGGLFLGARQYSESALAWMAAAGEGKGEASYGKRLMFFYRTAGAFWAGFGLWLLWKGLREPASLAAFLPRRRLGRTGRIAAGAFFMLYGSAMAAVKTAAGGKGRHRDSVLESELGLETSEPLLGQAQSAWGWVIVLALLAFGAYLLRRAAV